MKAKPTHGYRYLSMLQTKVELLEKNIPNNFFLITEILSTSHESKKKERKKMRNKYFCSKSFLFCTYCLEKETLKNWINTVQIRSKGFWFLFNFSTPLRKWYLWKPIQNNWLSTRICYLQELQFWHIIVPQAFQVTAATQFWKLFQTFTTGTVSGHN